MVTSGATEALAGALMALIEPGDEVVLFEPMYDAYLPLVRRAGGVPRFVTLQPPHFAITEEALAAVFSEKKRRSCCSTTRSIRRARCFPPRSSISWRAIASIFDAIALCDEVWEHIVFDGLQHLPLIAHPGMRERTVKIGSAGKIFSLTRLESRPSSAPSPRS